MRLPGRIVPRLPALAGWTWLSRVVLVPGVVVGLALGQQDAGSKVTSAGLRHATLRDVSSSRAFKDINRNDARAAIKVWLDVMAQRKGLLLDSKVDILDSVAEIRERLLSHTVELVTLAIPDYMELEGSGLIVPVLTDARNGQTAAAYSYVLLVNPSLGATAIASLRGKSLLVFSRGGSNTGMAWMDVHLGKEKLGPAASFFASLKATDKAQSCILPVFFGAVDACVVDEVSLSLAREMNPQLAKLAVLARSRPMIESVMAMPVVTSPYQKELIDAMLTLHEDPRGRQLLMVFKTDHLVRIQPGDLDAARELWRDYSRLPGSSPNRPSVFAPAETGQSGRGKERD